MADLINCPFCSGAASLALCGFGTARVVCMDCGSEGRYSPSCEEATAAWNRRTPARRNWQPICTAPTDGAHLLLARADGYIGVGYFQDDADFPQHWIMLGSGVTAPTHWMPLPDPPASATPSARPDAREGERK